MRVFLITGASSGIGAAAARALAAPKGLPPDVRAKLVAAIGKAVNDPEFQQKAAAAYAPVRYMDPAQFGALLCCVGLFPAAFWSYLVLAVALGQTVRLAATPAS